MPGVRCLLLIAAICACTEHGKGGGMVPDDGGTICGGFANAQCQPTEFCDFATNDCGAADGTGVCRPRPPNCPDIAEPTCGCDNRIHGSVCDTQSSGVDVNVNGTCPLPQGGFFCGWLQCNTASSYCRFDIRSNDTFTCVPLPVGCSGATSTCLCLAAEQCGQFCSGAGSTGLKLSCPG